MSTTPIDPDAGVELRDRYISLLRDAITMSLWEAADGSVLRSAVGSSRTLREQGQDWPALAHTMIGRRRMANLQFCVEDVLKQGVPGDLIETGAWRGGACIFMRGILAAYGVTDRAVWVADSFEGLPAPDPVKYPEDVDADFHIYAELSVDIDTVRKTFERYGLMDDQVRLLKGWFKDTLPTAPIGSLAVARLDGDLYESTMDSLTHLYPKLSPGGYLIVDDYGLRMCQQAVDDYRAAHDITEPIQIIDWTGVYWQKQG